MLAAIGMRQPQSKERALSLSTGAAWRRLNSDRFSSRQIRCTASLGSPLAASWIFRQLNQTREATLEAIFESELILGCNIMRHPEFAEGVRALLVDKDRSPAWTYPDLASVPADVVDSFFNAPADMPALGLPE